MPKLKAIQRILHPDERAAWRVCATVTVRGELPMKRETPALPNGFRWTRRNCVRIASAASAVVLARITTEADLAFAQSVRPLTHVPPDAILINANENPLGPCAQACSAMADLGVRGGRYEYGMTTELLKTFAEMEGLKPEYVRAYAGSSEPLHYMVLAFTSPEKSLVMGDPAYEAPMQAASFSKAKILKVPLTKNYAHDVKAMVAADHGLHVMRIVFGQRHLQNLCFAKRRGLHRSLIRGISHDQALLGRRKGQHHVVQRLARAGIGAHILWLESLHFRECFQEFRCHSIFVAAAPDAKISHGRAGLRARAQGIFVGIDQNRIGRNVCERANSLSEGQIRFCCDAGQNHGGSSGGYPYKVSTGNTESIWKSRRFAFHRKFTSQACCSGHVPGRTLVWAQYTLDCF